MRADFRFVYSASVSSYASGLPQMRSIEDHSEHECLRAYIPNCDCCMITISKKTTVERSMVMMIIHAISFLTKSLFLALISIPRQSSEVSLVNSIPS